MSWMEIVNVLVFNALFPGLATYYFCKSRTLERSHRRLLDERKNLRYEVRQTWIVTPVTEDQLPHEKKGPLAN